MPSRAKYRSAVNWASMRFSHDEYVGVYASSTLFVAAHFPTRWSVFVERCGLKLSSTIAIRTCGGCRVRRYRQNSKNWVRPFVVLMCPQSRSVDKS